MKIIRWHIAARVPLQGVRRYSDFKSSRFGALAPTLFDIEQLNDGNKANLEVFHRLSKAYQILGTGIGFKLSAFKCCQFYEKQNKILFQDLLKFPRINKQMIKFIMQNYDKSASIRVLVLNDIHKALVLRNPDLALQIIAHLIEEKHAPASVITAIISLNGAHLTVDSTVVKLANILIEQTVASGEHLLASSYALGFQEIGIRITDDNIHHIIDSLAINVENSYLYHCYTILKLIDKFEGKILQPLVVAKITDFFTENSSFQYFPNALYDKLKDNELLLQMEEAAFKRFKNALIELNLSNGNVSKAVDIFRETNVYPITEDDMTVIELLLSTEASFESTVAQLPEEILKTQNIADILLKRYGTSKTTVDKFDKLVKTLEPPLQRLTLSLLFVSFLYQNNEKAAELVLQSIFKSKNGISHNEFNAIITKLLEQGKMDQCLAMLKSTDIHVSKIAYISVFRRMLLENKLDPVFVEDMYRKFLKLRKSDESFALLAKEFIWYLSSRINNRLGKKYYAIISESTGKSELGSLKSVNLRQYNLPDKVAKLFIFSHRGTKVDTLKFILRQAIKEQDVSTIKWGIEELRFLGFDYEQILQNIRRMDKEGFLPEILKQEVLQSCK